VIEQGEDCDGAALGGVTCASVGFSSGTLSCSSACRFDVLACAGAASTTCGDGIAGGAEVCDGAALAGHTCAGIGFDSGPLGCNAACSGFDTSQCRQGIAEKPHNPEYYSFIESEYLAANEAYMHGNAWTQAENAHQPQYAGFDAFFASAMPPGSTLSGYAPHELLGWARYFLQGTRIYHTQPDHPTDFRTTQQAARVYLDLRANPDANEELRLFAADLLPWLDTRFGGQVETASHSRSMERAYGETVLAYLFPLDPSVGSWTAYRNAVWNAAMTQMDTVQNSSEHNAEWLHFVTRWTRAMEKFEPARAQAVYDDPAFKALSLRYLQLMSPIGVFPSYGASQGLHGNAGKLISAFETIASAENDPRFKWASRAMFAWTRTHLRPEDAQSDLAAQIAYDLIDAYQTSDEGIPAHTPDFNSVVTHRREVQWNFGSGEPELLDDSVPDKLVLRSGWDPSDLYALVELAPPLAEGHCDTASVTLLTANDSVLLSSPAYYAKDPSFHNSFLVSTPPAFPTGCSIANLAAMRTNEPFLSETARTVAASVSVDAYLNAPAKLHRRLFLLKNRFLWVADQIEATGAFSQQAGPAWQTGTLVAQGSFGASNHWADTRISDLPVAQAADLGHQLRWTNSPQGLLMVFPNKADSPLVVDDVSVDATHANYPADVENNLSTRIWSMRTVSLASGGKADFSTVLVPHEVGADGAAEAARFETLYQNSDYSVLRITGDGVVEFLGINENGREIDIPAGTKTPLLQTDARWFYLETQDGRLTGYWLQDATYLLADGTQMQSAPAPQDAQSFGS
jgi:hypothetical protein